MLFRTQGSCPFPSGIPSLSADLRVTGVSAGPPSVFSTIALPLLRVEYRSPAANRGLFSGGPTLSACGAFVQSLNRRRRCLPILSRFGFGSFGGSSTTVYSRPFTRRVSETGCDASTLLPSLILPPGGGTSDVHRVALAYCGPAAAREPLDLP